MKKILPHIYLTFLLLVFLSSFSVNATKWNFASTDDFPTVYANMADGDTLWLTTPGATAVYTNIAAITLTKAITIMADPTLTSRPIIKQATFVANTSTNFNKIEFVGFEAYYELPTEVATGKYFLDARLLATYAITTVKFKDCYIHGYGRCLLRGDGGAPTFSNILIDNCLFYDFGRANASYPILGVKSATTPNINITNTTFYNCPSYVIQHNNANVLTFSMDHCTILEMGSYASGTAASPSNAGNLFNFQTAANASSTFTISNSIIAGKYTNKDNSPMAEATYIGAVVPNVNNIKFNTATTTNVNFINSVLLDNQFSNPTTPGGTYSLITANSLSDNYTTLSITTDPTSITGIGDPRWHLNASAPLSTDATLKDLQVNGATVTGFTAATTDYNVTLPYGTTDVPAISATVNEPHATTVITPASSVTGLGTVVVTAQDGSTTKTYKIQFSVAAASTDATLTALSVNGNTLSPTFSSGTLEYNVTLPAGTTIGTLPAVTYTTAANATAVKTDATALPGTTLIAVTAQDGIASQTYKINFTVSTVQSQTITFTLPTGKVYGDADFDITGITSGGSGNPVQFASSNTAVATVSGNTIKILAAGTTTITATQAGNGSYADATPVQHDLVVGQATATVSLNGLSATYDATAKTVTASTTPTGLTVNITYAGSTTAPTNAGTYAIVATINDPNYKGSATDNLVINKATATVTLNGLSTTYDATAKTVTAGTTPTSLTVNITYNGSVTAPANAGTYPIVATVNDVNYTGTASDNLVIAKAPLTVTTEPATRMKGLANPAFVLKFTGFQGSDTKSVINPQPTATCSADASSVVGDYAVVVTGGTADNYTITYVNGTLTITVNTGTKSINGAEVKAYPNPVVSGKLNIEVPSFDKKSAITVTSTSGAQVIARKIDSNVTELNLTNVAPGLYIVRIETPDGVSIQQIVKQ